MNKLLLLIAFISFSASLSAQCTAGATAVLTGNPMSPAEVEFTNQSTGPSSAYILVDYGDGNSAVFTMSFLNTWYYTYSQLGSYYYCITIYDSINPSCIDTWCDSITISNVPAYCDASYTTDTLGSYLDIAFNTSGNMSNVSVTHVWDFGDGSTSTLANPNYSYALSGDYYVCHTVNDVGGQCSATVCDTLYVYPYSPPPPIPCQASFYWYQDSTTTQTVIAINNSSGSGGPGSMSYLWDFGDGTTSNLAYPSHVYSNLGTFLVCLTVTDNGNPFLPCTSTYCDSVYVTFKASGFTFNVYAPEVASLSELNETGSVSVHPNPGSDAVQINFVHDGQPKNFVLYDMHGHAVKGGVLNAPGESISVKELNDGFYFLKLEGFNPVRLVKE